MRENREYKLDVVQVKLVNDTPIMSGGRIDSPEAAVNLLGKYLKDMDREVMCVVNLKSDNTPINCHFASMGAINQTVAHPRELLKSSILSNAAKMILIHNHPSGNLTPSKEDIRITDRMIKVTEMLGIPLADHLIVGGKTREYFSFREKRILNKQAQFYETDYKNLNFTPNLIAAEKERGR